jgi:hypothetical protein
MIIKTGSTEVMAKLPTHVTTTMLCYRDYLIFSDYDDDLLGERIIDALGTVSSSIQETHADFGLWRRLRDRGRASMLPSELHHALRVQSDEEKFNNPGWILDKWKFLPMMVRTFYELGYKRWYVFVETDTFVFWHGLLQYLSRFDHNEALYIGGQIDIGGASFAHGGSGFAVSYPAMKRIVEMLADKQNQTHWENITDSNWAGDCVLGQAFAQVGAQFQIAWPTLQGNPVGDMDFSENGLWCEPAVSYHHMVPEEIEELWGFEQSWIASARDVSKPNYQRKGQIC